MWNPIALAEHSPAVCATEAILRPLSGAQLSMFTTAPATYLAATLCYVRDHRGDLLCAAIRLSLAAPARQLSALARGVSLLLGAARRRVFESLNHHLARRDWERLGVDLALGGGHQEPEREDAWRTPPPPSSR